MAESLIFLYSPGDTPLHKTDAKVKLAGMILISLILVSVNAYRLIILLPLLTALQITAGKGEEQTKVSPFFLIMPLIIFLGNFFSISASGVGDTIPGLVTASMRTIRFVFILWIAQLFTKTTDPLSITPAFYFFLKFIPFLPSRRISTQMGLTLTLIPMILEEYREIRDAMESRCGWSRRRPVRNLYHLGLPLLEGVLRKAEALSDAMESRLYQEDATEPEQYSDAMTKIPSIILFFLVIAVFAGEKWAESYGWASILLRFY